MEYLQILTVFLVVYKPSDAAVLKLDKLPSQLLIQSKGNFWEFFNQFLADFRKADEKRNGRAEIRVERGKNHEINYLQVLVKIFNKLKYFSVCPLSENGLPQHACPSTDVTGSHVCIDDNMLCDDVTHCPGNEDENEVVCMFHKIVSFVFLVI